MNIRKAFLLTLIVAIAFIGLTLTGCEKKSDHPTGDHPSAGTAAKCPKCGEVAGSDACCMTKAAETATKCPKCGEAVGNEACCMTKAAKEAAATVEGAEKALEETKAAAEKPAADHPGH